MEAKIEFLERELAFVRVIRGTRKDDKLHLVEPAVERERAILAEIAQLKRNTEPLLAGASTGNG